MRFGVTPSTTAALSRARANLLAIPGPRVPCFDNQEVAFSISIDNSYASAAVVLGRIRKPSDSEFVPHFASSNGGSG